MTKTQKGQALIPHTHIVDLPAARRCCAAFRTSFENERPARPAVAPDADTPDLKKENYFDATIPSSRSNSHSEPASWNATRKNILLTSAAPAAADRRSPAAANAVAQAPPPLQRSTSHLGQDCPTRQSRAGQATCCGPAAASRPRSRSEDESDTFTLCLMHPKQKPKNHNGRLSIKSYTALLQPSRTMGATQEQGSPSDAKTRSAARLLPNRPIVPDA